MRSTPNKPAEHARELPASHGWLAWYHAVQSKKSYKQEKGGKRKEIGVVVNIPRES
jgi:hypothetical protein